jgi:hypothetical protein
MMTKEFEEETLRRGYNRVYLHARGYAVDFYLSQGYEVFGEDFVEVGIPHKHVQKYLKKTEDISEPKIEEEVKTSISITDFKTWISTTFE